MQVPEEPGYYGASLDLHYAAGPIVLTQTLQYLPQPERQSMRTSALLMAAACRTPTCPGQMQRDTAVMLFAHLHASGVRGRRPLRNRLSHCISQTNACHRMPEERQGDLLFSIPW